MWVQPYQNPCSDYPKSLIIRINEVYEIFNKYHHSDILLKMQTSYITVCFAAITLCYNGFRDISMSRYVTSASRIV